MLTKPATPEMLAEWRSVWAEYHDRLSPNRKSGAELAAYLGARYKLRETRDEQALKVVALNVTENEYYARKLCVGAKPKPVAFFIDEGAEADDYPVFVGIDLSSGFFQVELCEALWDELLAFRGLDADDIENCFIVAQYIAALKRFGRLAEALKGDTL